MDIFGICVLAVTGCIIALNLGDKQTCLTFGSKGGVCEDTFQSDRHMLYKSDFGGYMQRCRRVGTCRKNRACRKDNDNSTGTAAYGGNTGNGKAAAWRIKFCAG